MATKDRKKKDEEEQGKQAAVDEEREEETNEDMQAYLLALNQFSQLVHEFDWPEHMDLAQDSELCIRMFRDFWRQQRRDNHLRNQGKRGRRGDRDHAAFGHLSEDTVRRFMKDRFFRHFHDEEETRSRNAPRFARRRRFKECSEEYRAVARSIKTTRGSHDGEDSKNVLTNIAQ